MKRKQKVLVLAAVMVSFADVCTAQTVLGRHPVDKILPSLFSGTNRNADTILQGLSDYGTNGLRLNAMTLGGLTRTNWPTGDYDFDPAYFIVLGNTVSLKATPTPLTIGSLTNSVGTQEVGAAVSETKLGWTISGGTPTYQALNQGIGSINAGLRAWTNVAVYTSSRTYTLTVSNATHSATASTTVSFLYKRYWGPSSNASLTDEQVIGLGGAEFASSRTTTKTITCSGQYIYLCWPASWGTGTFTVNGLLNTDWTLVTRDFVNGSGAVASCHIYRSGNVLWGTFIVGVQ